MNSKDTKDFQRKIKDLEFEKSNLFHDKEDLDRVLENLSNELSLALSKVHTTD